MDRNTARRFATLETRAEALLFEHRSTKPREGAMDGRLSQDDAVDIWIARWLRIRPKDLIMRYGCDPRRLYEIWAEDKFIGSRALALMRFRDLHPGLVDRIDFGPHQRISTGIDEDLQPDMFD